MEVSEADIPQIRLNCAKAIHFKRKAEAKIVRQEGSIEDAKIDIALAEGTLRMMAMLKLRLRRQVYGDANG